jgi:hypothetical protein
MRREPPEELDLQVLDLQEHRLCQLFTALPRFRGGGGTLTRRWIEPGHHALVAFVSLNRLGR